MGVDVLIKLKIVLLDIVSNDCQCPASKNMASLFMCMLYAILIMLSAAWLSVFGL